MPIKQNSTKGFVKVLPQTGNSLLKNVQRRTSFLTVWLLVGEVVVQDLVNRVCMGQRDQLLVLGDVLPVVYKEGFNMIGDWELDRGPGEEGVLLRLVSESVGVAQTTIR
jgi:hypothetical protein